MTTDKCVSSDLNLSSVLEFRLSQKILYSESQTLNLMQASIIPILFFGEIYMLISKIRSNSHRGKGEFFKIFDCLS